jgi:isoleucyl-tRNA synthetase
MGIWTKSNDLIDLHKNVVDEITLLSPSGKPMTRALI